MWTDAPVAPRTRTESDGKTLSPAQLRFQSTPVNPGTSLTASIYASIDCGCPASVPFMLYTPHHESVKRIEHVRMCAPHRTATTSRTPQSKRALDLAGLIVCTAPPAACAGRLDRARLCTCKTGPHARARRRLGLSTRPRRHQQGQCHSPWHPRAVNPGQLTTRAYTRRAAIASARSARLPVRHKPAVVK